jgi:hypothetical protein
VRRPPAPVRSTSPRAGDLWRPIALAGFASLLLVAVGAAQAAEAAVGPSKIRITNQEKRFFYVDVGQRGRSPGDQEISSYALFNKRIRAKPIGHSEMVCTYTFGPSRSCRVTYFMPQGRLVAGGDMRFRQLYQLAVLGGTGLYNNARGTLTVTRIKRRPRQERVVFRLVG